MRWSNADRVAVAISLVLMWIGGFLVGRFW